MGIKVGTKLVFFFSRLWSERFDECIKRVEIWREFFLHVNVYMRVLILFRENKENNSVSII